MAFNVDQFRSNLIGDGARPNLFEVKLSFPDFVSVPNQIKSPFLCKSSSLPGSTIAPANLFYFGREVKLAGNRTFPDWQVSILNDEDFLLKNAFDQWHNGINENILNLRNFRAVNASPIFTGIIYTVDATINHFSKKLKNVSIYF
jgi:hypothetical protein